MKKIKKSLLALAAFCAITSSANAYTIGLSVHYPGISEYQITFFENLSYKQGDWGKCNFCWFDNCWKYDYFYDGYYTIIIDKVGMFILNKAKTRVYDLPFNTYFKSAADSND